MSIFSKVSFAVMLVAMVGSWVVDDGRMGNDTSAEIFWMKVVLLAIVSAAVATEYDIRRAE